MFRKNELGSFIRKIYWSLGSILFILIAWLFQSNVEFILNSLNSFGVFTPCLFLLIYCLVSILFLPTLPLVLAGGFLFGPITGTIMNLLGATSGAACGFCISRYLRPAYFLLEKNYHVQRWMTQVERGGWKTVALLRLTPIIPFNLINYGMGVTPIKFSHYIVATMIFLIPTKIIVTCTGYYGINFFDSINEHLMQKIADFFG